jgi:flagella basal body P-ring formation protein FlgA
MTMASRNSTRRFGRAVAALAAVCAILSAAAPVSATTQRLPVPRIAIYPGDPIVPDQLTERLFDARSVSQTAIFMTPDAVLGKVARRTLLPGKPIPVNALRDAYVVTQGKSAFVVFQSDGLTITGLGVALQSGGVGDVVSLRNADTGTIIRGTVMTDGSVRVGTQ